MKLPTIKQIASGKTILLRTDFNVPLKNNKISDNSRLVAAIPTIKYLLKKNSKVVIISHLGRPNGSFDKKYSLSKVAIELSHLLNKSVFIADDCVGEDIEDLVKFLPKKSVILLENLRFHKEEKENSPSFAKKLSKLADVYVNDAFGTCHRKHASVHVITKYLPSYVGLLIENEIKQLSKLLDPKRPFIVIMGGAKVKDKLIYIKKLLGKCDHLLLGGKMATTFLQAKGIINSQYEKDFLNEAIKLNKNKKLVLPSDFTIATKEFQQIENSTSFSKNKLLFDLGKETSKNYSNIISNSKTIFWNGPLGYFEKKPFDKSTKELIKKLNKIKATIIVGGGETTQAAKKYKLNATHISTGGGASLNFVTGIKLPALEAIRKNQLTFNS